MVFAQPPPRRRAGQTRRDAYQTPRRRKLSPEQETAIRVKADTCSLRDLAGEFGVSRETVRTVLRDRAPSAAAMPG